MICDDLAYLSASDALSAFRAKTLSPVELMQAVISQAEAWEPKINAFTDTYFEDALAVARKSEDRYMKGGRLRRLEGLPMVIKDEIRLKGRRTTAGSLIFKDHIDTESDVMAERLLGAGAICHARTTTPEFCIAGMTHSRIWGITRNPWNLDFDVGGSSGGSGASLAAGTTILATGTDIGGSIRIPASCCGVVGYKPPYGRNPETPVFNLDYYSHSGPMARTVADCALMQNIISGPHPRDIASLRNKVTIPENPPGIKGFRIAYSLDLGYFEVDRDVRENTLRAVEVFRSLGAQVEEVSLNWTRKTAEAAQVHLLHMFGAHVEELYDQHADQMTDYAREFAERSRRTTAADFLEAEREAVRMYDEFGPLMEHFDVFLCPTLAFAAAPAGANPFAIDVELNGRQVTIDEESWCMTYPFNMLSRCPVMSVPSGRDAKGVPTGLQIVGRTYDDVRVFRAAQAFENVAPWMNDTKNRPSLTT